MNNEVLIPKMQRVRKTGNISSIFNLNFFVTILCLLLLIASTFINIDLKQFIIPHDLFSNKQLGYNDFIYSIFFIPQIPVLFFVCSVLGKKLAMFCTVLYIILGIFFVPIFALGGGITYITQYGFGYILGYIPAVAIFGNLLGEKASLKDMAKAIVAGVLIIHLIGVTYMLILAILKHAGGDFIVGWIGTQSGIKIIYDIIIGFYLILFGKYINLGLKFISE